VSHRAVRVEDGFLRIDQRISLPGREVGTDLSGPACVYAHVRVTRGTVAYLRGRSTVPAPPCFVLFMPPFAIVQALLDDACEVVSACAAFRGTLVGEFPAEPVLFAPGTGELPGSVDEALRRVAATDGRVAVGRACDPPALPARAKAIIDAEYDGPLQIGRVAARLEVSAPRLSRAFKQVYGVPPVRYRHHVRIMDALMRLADGAAPLDVFQDVGFDDLSRFYKVFQTVACAAPGTYRPGRSTRSRNAKT
jgi:AraC-like DNA-binding protein